MFVCDSLQEDACAFTQNSKGETYLTRVVWGNILSGHEMTLLCVKEKWIGNGVWRGWHSCQRGSTYTLKRLSQMQERGRYPSRVVRVVLYRQFNVCKFSPRTYAVQYQNRSSIYLFLLDLTIWHSVLWRNDKPHLSSWNFHPDICNVLIQITLTTTFFHTIN